MVTQAIKLRYSNTWVLEESLSTMFGSGQYSIEFSMGQFVLNVPRKLTTVEIQQIQDQMGHYEQKDGRHCDGPSRRRRVKHSDM